MSIGITILLKNKRKLITQRNSLWNNALRRYEPDRTGMFKPVLNTQPFNFAAFLNKQYPSHKIPSQKVYLQHIGK